MKVVSYDFDDTLTRRLPTGEVVANKEVISTLWKHWEEGCTIIIVTYRNHDHETQAWRDNFQENRISIAEFVAEHKLPISATHFTSHDPKGPLLMELGCVLHYDDDPAAIDSAEEHGVRGVWIDPHWDGPIVVIE
jgi:acid phosphatase class B